MLNVQRKFAANLKQQRRDYNLNQAQLALRVGCHEHTVSDWECSKRLPNPDQQRALRAVFGDTALLDVRALAAYEDMRHEH
jgi:DNA-binding transcriptional regulator YiaG